MSDSFVADASIGVAWVHPAQATPQTQTLLQQLYDGAAVHVPTLWLLEVANVLLILKRRSKLTDAERLQALGALRSLSLQIDHEGPALALTKVSKLAAEQRITVYDATYLELAQRRKLPLACKDGPLRDAAKRCKVRLL